MAQIGGRRLKERGKPCPYCRQPMTYRGAHEATPDHVTARAKGGRGGINILYVCRRCNLDKKDMSPVEFHAKLVAASDRRAAIVQDFINHARSVIHKDFDPSK